MTRKPRMLPICLGLISLIAVSCGKEKTKIEIVDSAAERHRKTIDDLNKRIADLEDGRLRRKLERKVYAKRKANTLGEQNRKALSLPHALNDHSKIYKFHGSYRVIVIPVQFSDVKFEDPEFFKHDTQGKSKAQEYIFGKNPNSMAQYYAHASFGKLKLDGEVTPIVTVDKKLVNYGEAIPRRSDRNARGLVVDALEKLKAMKSTTPGWWESFDNWDLSDYDGDKNFHEPDGFLDAVILVYAGKSQASCQASFDPKRVRPASRDVPPGPRHDAAVECFNRIWPHRWAIALNRNDPRYSLKGPLVEGQTRPSSNGLKITDHVFALDYNMQSEFSDLSTFIHEFGHSLSLPDVYSSGRGNSTGQWTVMSSNSEVQAQELGSFSKLTLGWLYPKVVKQGEKTSAYLGSYNLATKKQREMGKSYQNVLPTRTKNGESIVSKVPEFNEPVFRSIAVLTNPTHEKRKVVDPISQAQRVSAYSGRFDGEGRSLKLNFKVPTSGPATLSFDSIYHIETETNFRSKDPKIKVVTDYDLGYVIVNGKIKETLRLISGDKNFDSLAELNPACQVSRVLVLRKKVYSKQATKEEIEEFKKKATICRSPIWVKKTYDLSDLRGKNAEIEIRYITDAGYTEFGIILDNIKVGNTIVDFEEDNAHFGKFKALVDGKENLTYNQFYLFEYRNPLEEWNFSYNMDKNIKVGTQAMFLDKGKTLREQFRLIKFNYRPGVLVWYFNSKFGRTQNNAAAQKGKGYLLALNSKVQELKLPGALGKAKYFDSFGNYKTKDPEFKSEIKKQKKKFVCFSHTKYATYLNGKEPDCSRTNSERNLMKTFTFNGKNMLFRRERFNEFHPLTRYSSFGVGSPFRNFAAVRTGLSTFNPKTDEDFRPFTVFKEVDGKMVVDKKLTEQSSTFSPIDSFHDAKNDLIQFKRFHGDSVVVEKKGFAFRVAAPSKRITSLYSNSDEEKADSNEHAARRPRAKIYFDWK